MARVKFGESQAEPIEIELWERVYTIRKVTRTVQRQIRELEEKLDEATDDDQAVDLFADLIDVVAVATNGQRKSAGALLKEQWRADKYEIRDIENFVAEVREVAQQRPS